jgi:GT2 family glycosyltransferase
MKFPDISIVILNYNGLHFLKKYLPNVILFSKNAKVVVADNASTDGSQEWLKENFPATELLILEKNWGFCEGYNKALAQLNADYFLLLNSDVEVSENWLEPLAEFLENNPDFAAVQPKIRAEQAKEKFEFAGAAGGMSDEWGFLFCRGRIFDTLETDFGQYDAAGKEIFWASGAAMLVRARLFHDFGGFDSDFFAHFEEVDLCWRWQNAGFKIGFEPKSLVFHVGGGTLPQGTYRKTYLNFRNNLATMIKNLPPKNFLPKMFLRFCLDGIAGVRFFMQGKFSLVKAVIYAHFYIYANIFFLYKKRQKARSAAKISGLPPSMMRGSIVYQYFVKKKKTYSEIFSKSN